MSTSSSGSSDAGRSLLQNSIYIGVTLQDILYGMELFLYFRTIQVLLSNRSVRRKFRLFYAIFSSVMVLSITVWVATSAFFGEKMWLLDSDYPGGPDAFFDANISVWYMDWGTTAVILLQLMTDGLMIYRCRIMWNSNRVIIIPAFLWLSTLVLGILVDWTSSLPGGNFFAGISSQLALAYYAVSVFLNTLLTCLICYRMVRHGRLVREQMGHEYASLYFSIVTLVVESVLPYTLAGIAFLVSLGVGSSMSETFLPVYLLMMCMSPQMLILRVVSGKAWNNDTTAQAQALSTIKFGASCAPRSEQTDSSGTAIHLQTLSKPYIPEGRGKVVISPV